MADERQLSMHSPLQHKRVPKRPMPCDAWGERDFTCGSLSVGPHYMPGGHLAPAAAWSGLHAVRDDSAEPEATLKDPRRPPRFMKRANVSYDMTVALAPLLASIRR